MSAPTLEDAYARCRAIVAARAKNFLYAFLLLPGERRRGLEAIYAWCRVADDLADDDDRPLADRARALAALRARLRAALPLPGDPPDAQGDVLAPGALGDAALEADVDALLVALADTARRFGVARADLDDVARGCEQDLTVVRYATWDDLAGYCRLVASAVGLACLPVFGVVGDPEAARAEADALGLAMQLTNVLRDVTEDLARDRVYLPQDELARFGVTEAALRAGRADEAWRAFAAFQVARARDLFATGLRMVPRVRRRSRVCPLALAGLYGALLDRIEAQGHDVFSGRVALSTPRKLGLMGAAFGRGALC